MAMAAPESAERASGGGSPNGGFALNLSLSPEAPDMAAESAERASDGDSQNGGFALNLSLRAKGGELRPGALRSLVAQMVRGLALSVERGDGQAARDLYLLLGTLRNQGRAAKAALKLPRGQRERESPEIGAAAKRMLKGLADRADEGDIMALHELAVLRTVLRDETTRAARALNSPDEHGHSYSWAQIGQAAGITMQAAHKRWAPPETPREPAEE
jgi:hypothetical protein